ncbi:MAG: hypothetical protein RIM23_14510 [Coleofasciculus sp. G3-WIS-01]
MVVFPEQIKSKHFSGNIAKLPVNQALIVNPTIAIAPLIDG